MNTEHSEMAANGVIHAARESFERAASCMTDPSVLYRPKLSIDGGVWCALYGENLQDGVAGFGKSPADAMAAFDREWFAKLEAKP